MACSCSTWLGRPSQGRSEPGGHPGSINRSVRTVDVRIGASIGMQNPSFGSGDRDGRRPHGPNVVPLTALSQRRTRRPRQARVGARPSQRPGHAWLSGHFWARMPTLHLVGHQARQNHHRQQAREARGEHDQHERPRAGGHSSRSAPRLRLPRQLLNPRLARMAA
jgi:hypothetical protein